MGIDMENPRKYGDPPYGIAVLHGGPGAAGEMAPVARELSAEAGVLEPLQTAMSVDGQVEELRAIIEGSGEPPVTIVGWSWGAWLGWFLASRHPGLVKKLILVCSGPFEDKYATGIMGTRLDRLTDGERAETHRLIDMLNDPRVPDKDVHFAGLGALMSSADARDPRTIDDDPVDFCYDIYLGVWDEAAVLRRSGELLVMGRGIDCPVVAIHGDHDPHPADGVFIPLAATLQDFRFELLTDCGHKPWSERKARDNFYRVLGREL